MSTVIARQVTKAVVPLILLVSINFFLQGHNRPGGGFIAGVMTSAGIALIYIVFDFEGLKELKGKMGREKYSTVARYLPTSGLGLLLAAGTGLLAVSLGSNFMDHSMGNLYLPFFGKIHWTTAILFDLGVYLTVVGSLLTMVEVLGEE